MKTSLSVDSPMPSATSSLSPPMYVDQISADPVELILVTNASEPPLFVFWKTVGDPWVGKSNEVVWPVTYTLFVESIAIEYAVSVFEPPRYVDQRSWEVAPLSFVTKTSWLPLFSVLA